MLQIIKAMLALGLEQSECVVQAVIPVDLQATALSHPDLFAALLPAAASCSLPMRKTSIDRWASQSTQSLISGPDIMYSYSLSQIIPVCDPEKVSIPGKPYIPHH